MLGGGSRGPELGPASSTLHVPSHVPVPCPPPGDAQGSALDIAPQTPGMKGTHITPGWLQLLLVV